MLTGPMAGLTASICVAGPATERAAAPILAVIEAVVFGLTTRSFMRRDFGSRYSLAKRRRRMIDMLVIATMMMMEEKAVVSVPSA